MMNQDVVTFIGFFFAGLAVNLTPCVYPMMTVTAALFKPHKSAHETTRHAFSKALAYVLGISVMYSTLGFLAATSGKLFGSALQSSWVLGAVALMMLILSLSMFGFFHLSVPGELLHFLGRFRRVNYMGLFASGMLVGIFAAPCIGPPVVALMAVVAKNGDPRFGFWAFFVFSLGLGVPYLLLGTFSKFITHLPKAGKWLIWVERFFGVVLLGFSIFYLSLALHWSPKSENNQSKIWQPYSQEMVEKAISQNKPVIIDFYAEWCSGCKELDHAIFENPRYKNKFSGLSIFRVDATRIDSPQVEKVIDQYSVFGLPTIVFLDANGKEVKKARVEGIRNPEDFLNSLNLWASQVHLSLKD